MLLSPASASQIVSEVSDLKNSLLLGWLAMIQIVDFLGLEAQVK